VVLIRLVVDFGVVVIFKDIWEIGGFLVRVDLPVFVFFEVFIIADVVAALLKTVVKVALPVEAALLTEKIEKISVISSTQCCLFYSIT
jgi:intracellular septation protein A